jgi:cytochrome P450
MPYLQASMKEALRLHPGVGFPLERLVPAGGATVCGKALKEGTIVGMNAWALHRDREVFGDDAEVYRPERWIEADKGRLKAMERSFFSFGHGPRACIGKNISILEMSKVVPQLLRYYDLEMAAGVEAEWTIHNYWFARQTGLVVRMTPRARRREILNG